MHWTTILLLLFISKICVIIYCKVLKVLGQMLWVYRNKNRVSEFMRLSVSH